MKEIVNLPELSKKLRNLSGWFGITTTSLTPEGRAGCIKVCEDAANELDAFRERYASFNYKDYEIPEMNGDVGLWYVIGIPNKFYPTKIVAEQAARSTFPNDPNNAYGRVMFIMFKAFFVQEC